MAELKIKRLESAALLEVLVAITVIVLVFTAATIIFLNVTSSSYTGEKLRAGKALDWMLVETKRKKSFFDEDLKVGELRVEKIVMKYQDANNLLLVELKAFNSNEKLLGERKEVVLFENKE